MIYAFVYLENLSNQVSFSADRKKMLQKTNFKFGNDGPTRRTAYADFARIDNSAFRYQRPCPPPTLAKMLPDPMTCCLYPGRSTIRSDYTYFGPDIAEVVHSDRLANLGLVKVGSRCQGVETHACISLCYFCAF